MFPSFLAMNFRPNDCNIVEHLCVFDINFNMIGSNRIQFNRWKLHGKLSFNCK